MIHPDPEKETTHEVIKSSIVFVGSGDCNNPRICPQLPVLKCKNKHEIKPMRIPSLSDGDLSSPNTHLDHPERDLILPGSSSQSLLVPRVGSLKHTGMTEPKNIASLANVLDAVFQVTLLSSIRGHDGIVSRDHGVKYCRVGNKVSQNCVGIK